VSDRLRELVGDPYADLHDCDPYPALLADAERLLAELKDAQERGETHPMSAPWSNVADDIRDTEATIADLRAKIDAGITTAVQDKARQLEDEQEWSQPLPEHF